MTNFTAQPSSAATASASAGRLCFITPIALTLVTALVGWVLAGGPVVKLGVPLIYEGDGLLMLTVIKRVIENEWIYHTDLMGTPFGSSLYDYPMPDSGSLLALKILGSLFGGPAAALNFYYLLGFPLNALAAYFVLRKFNLSRTLSFAGGLIYTIAPFHFMRLPHLFYTWYFVAPIFVWYAYRISTGSFGWKKGKGKQSTLVIDVCAVLAASCFGVYYALFGLIAFLGGGIIRSLSTRKFSALLPSLLAVGIVTLGIAANVAPNLLDRSKHAANPEAVQRFAYEAEIHGLKLVQLLLPRPEHRLPKFASLNAQYSNSFPLVYENRFAALGLIGSIGLLFLLTRLLIPQPSGEDGRLLHVLAGLTLVLLLASTIGGFSSLFSLLISPAIRGWNRVSIFIAFTSVCAAMIGVKYLGTRVAPRRSIIAVALCALALWDQTTNACTACLVANEAAWVNDAKFVANIEKQVPQGSMIYQLPYIGFPEVPHQHKLGTYDLGRAYLHSSSLKWSYGGMKGRPGDLFFRALAQQPTSRQLSILESLGFAGIYIDRRGYIDQGAAIERELTQLLGKPATLVSNDGQQAFFALASNPANAASLTGLSDKDIMERVDFVADTDGERYRGTLQQGIDFSRSGWPRFVSSVEGLSILESWGRWSDANLARAVKVSFADALPKQFVLNIEAQAFGPNAGNPVMVSIGGQSSTFMPTARMQQFSLHFAPAEGSREITIAAGNPRSPYELGIGGDQRKIGIGLRRLSVQPD